MQPYAQVTEAFEGQGVFAGDIRGGVDPGPGFCTHKVQGVFKGRSGDTGVDSRVKNLRQRAYRGRALEGGLEGDHVLGGDQYIVEHHRATARGALAKSAPVIDHVQAVAVAAHKRQMLDTVIVYDRGRNPLRIQRAGGVELAAGDAVTVFGPGQVSGAVMGSFSADFSQGIAEALPGQHFGIQPLFLLVCAIDPQHFECIKMVLRDLSQGGVSRGDQRDHLGQGDVGHPRATIGLGHANAPQAGMGKQLKLIKRQAPFAIAQGAVALEMCGQFTRYAQGLGIAVDNRDLFGYQ